MKQSRCLAQDMFNMSKILALLFIQCIFFVSIPATLSKLGSCESLEEVIQLQSNELNHTCEYLYRLFSLLLVFDTYVLIVRSIGFSLLVPSACLAEAIRPYFNLLYSSTSRSLSANELRSGVEETARPSVICRFWSGVILWFSLLILSILGMDGQYLISVNKKNNDDDDNNDDEKRYNYHFPLIVVSLILFLSFLPLLKSTSSWRISETDFISSHIRLTWPNIFALLSIYFESFQIISLILINSWFTFDSEDNEIVMEQFPKWVIKTTKVFIFQYGDMTFKHYFSLSCMFVWIVVITLPLAEKDKQSSNKEGVSSSATFRNIISFLGNFSFISLVLLLLNTSYDEESKDMVIITLQLCCLLFYLITSQILSADSCLRSSPKDCELDIKYSQIFINFIQLTQFFIIILLLFPNLIFANSSVSVLTIVLGLTTFQFIWVVIYPYLPNTKGEICCVRSIYALRTCARYP